MNVDVSATVIHDAITDLAAIKLHACKCQVWFVLVWEVLLIVVVLIGDYWLVNFGRVNEFLCKSCL